MNLPRRCPGFITIFTVALLMLAVACNEQRIQKLAAAKGLLALIPENVETVISVNFQKLARLTIFDKILKSAFSENTGKPDSIFKDYNDFVRKTGIDLKQDVKKTILGFRSGGRKEGKAEKNAAVAVIELRYEKEKILRLLRENCIKIEKDAYQALPVYTYRDQANQSLMFTFLTENIAAAGTPTAVRAVIDTGLASGKSVLDNPRIAPYLKEIRSDKILSLASVIPEETRRKANNGRYKIDLNWIKAVYGHLARGDKNWKGDLCLISADETKNQKLIYALNSIKYLFGLANPHLSETVNKTDISALANGVQITVTITDAFVEKLNNQQRKDETTPSGNPE